MIDYDYVKETDFVNTFSISKRFNKTTYYVFFCIDGNKIYVVMSSGKKRKHKHTFEEKENKSDGGIPALLWVKDVILAFPKWLKNSIYQNRYNDPKYIQLKGSDSRRQLIYKYYLKKYGFYTEQDNVYGKILCKRLVH